MDTVHLYVGFDQREASAYHVFSQSVIAHASVPVALHPLAPSMLGGFDAQRDGSNAFLASRYLVPALCDFKGWAIWADGDMVLTRDIAELTQYRDESKAVLLVKHQYKTRHPMKYIGSEMQCPNVDYPRKNWSSFILWNCAHPSNAILTSAYVSNATSTHLHRFQWLKDEEIGDLPHDWNHLIGEDGPASAANNHFTLGIPGLRKYADDQASWHWHQNLIASLECAGEDASAVVRRAQDRIGHVSRDYAEVKYAVR